MLLRNRIKELRWVEAGTLKPNPKNWRTHPEQQENALKGVLAEVGIANACIARELDDGSLMLIDGHLRAETITTNRIPVLVLDVNEAEADKLLATLDPLAAMAESNPAKLEELLRNVDTGSEALQQLMAATADAAGLYATLDSTDDVDDGDTDTDGQSPYTDKIEVPPYAVIGDKPAMSQLYDNAYTQQLLDDIDAADVPDDEKHFLRVAAYRHSVFNFQEIANYYAHSDATVQRLMERSALVIVDLKAAIKNGWTRLSQSLDDIYTAQSEAQNAE